MFCFVQVLQEIFQTEDKIMMLERSMKAKDTKNTKTKNTKSVQTHLQGRTERLCHDAPQFQ